MSFDFEVLHKDKKTRARAGRLQTSHGSIETPVFMPVGTQGTVKACTPDELVEVGSQIILGNTYHLYLRPGVDVIERAGGLHRFSSWNRPILTDSGGFQVYSLSGLRKVSDDGVVFQSHYDGSYHELTPERAIDIQRALGSDIMMVLDECPPYPCTEKYAAEAVARTTDWARRCRDQWCATEAKYGHEQALFAIVQGSTVPELRRMSTEALIELEFPGYAIGGLSIGEPKGILFEMVAVCTEMLPEAKPRYLMGMGKPTDLLAAIARGVDMFDCVIPTRNGRKGHVFTRQGPIHLRNAQFKQDFRPIEETCRCHACLNFTKAYIRHLLMTDEILGLRLGTLHNLFFYHQLVSQAREYIAADDFADWKRDFETRYDAEP